MPVFMFTMPIIMGVRDHRAVGKIEGECLFHGVTVVILQGDTTLITATRAVIYFSRHSGQLWQYATGVEAL